MDTLNERLEELFVDIAFAEEGLSGTIDRMPNIKEVGSHRIASSGRTASEVCICMGKPS